MPTVKQASTQYNDMRGTVALDFHESGADGFTRLAELCGLDIDQYQPVAMSLYPAVEPTGSQPREGMGIEFYVVKMADRERLNSIVDSGHRQLTVQRFGARIDYATVFRKFKRFEMVVSLKSIADKIEIQYDDDGPADLGWVGDK